MLLKSNTCLGVAPEHWQRGLHIMAASCVGDPVAVMAANPRLLPLDHAAPSFVQRSMLLQRFFSLTAAQLYEQHAHCLCNGSTADIALRLLFVTEQPSGKVLLVVDKRLERGRQRQLADPAADQPRLVNISVIIKNGAFLAAAGVTAEQLRQFAAVHPVNLLLERAQEEARQELQRLEAVVGPAQA